MKNTFGQSVSVTLFGESHGEAVGAVIDGLAPGIAVDTARINALLARRRPSLDTDSSRREPDEYRIISGVFKGFTTGSPICILIPNTDVKSSDYSCGIARPSHADYSAYCKYHGFEDYRGGGHFSGRVTAALVAAGGIMLPALEKRGIYIGTHILRCACVEDRPFEDVGADIATLNSAEFPTLDSESGEKITREILAAKLAHDSVGGVTQTAIAGLPAGLGEPWFDSVESLISHAVFGIGGVKGIEFGAGFTLADKRAGDCNDAFQIKNGRVVTETNNNGGINGGITNAMPVVFQCAVKPTPSIAKKQRTVNFRDNTETEIEISGRHDPAIIRRVCPVMDSVTALVVCDLLAQRFGTDYLSGNKE